MLMVDKSLLEIGRKQYHFLIEFGKDGLDSDSEIFYVLFSRYGDETCLSDTISL